MELSEIKAINKSVKKRLIDLDVPHHKIASEVEKKLGRPVSPATLSFALSGRRRGTAYQEVLHVAQKVIEGLSMGDVNLCTSEGKKQE